MPADKPTDSSSDLPSTIPTGDKPSVVAPLVSILIPCCGMLEFTKLLIPNLLHYTRSPYELIFLDIGSLDGSAEYLAGLAAGRPDLRVEVVRTATDLGLGDACKEAIGKVRGEYVVLLNNDTIVTHGWLQQLIGLANLSPAVGMVGPMTNYAAAPQLVETIPYRLSSKDLAIRDGQKADVSAMHRFAAEHREQNKTKWMQTDRLGGFCLLMKREVLRRLTNQGGLEKWTDLGLFDTDILSSKAREAGFTLAVCRDLFVHHFGTRTFAHGAPSTAEPTR